ncbi:MAG: hypothetical protein AAGA48_39270 [Myxococcota bacterium]
MLDPMVLGPLNGGLLLACLVVGVAFVARSLGRLNRAELVEALPLAGLLALPLGLAVYSANVQLPVDVLAAKFHPVAEAKQTLWALAIHKSILTQLYGGVIVGGLALWLIVGSLVLTVPGERPRLALGQAAVLVAVCFALVVGVGLSIAPSWLLVARTVLYAVALFSVVSALVAAHRRGPGVQLAVVSAVAFPLFVAGVDQATIAWATGMRLYEIALAPPSDKAAMMESTLSMLGTLRGFSGVHLGLAAGLALLGPVAAWRTHRTLAWQNLAAVASVVVLSAVGVGFASTWLAGF